jgi:sodium/potassium/calcium exchanger 6
LFAFVQAIFFMMAATEELVNLLESICLMLEIPPSLIGLTVFALGNSLGELVTNTSIARSSSPVIALSACYGGPMLSNSS